MTALKDFQRLESPGIWRATPDARRRDVIVSFGDAALTLSDHQETAITHWSLPAVERINPGERPATFRPGQDALDVLEITDDTMIRAITKVQSAIRRRRPHPGRLRLALVTGAAALIAALAIFWLPGAMVRYTASVVPMSKRAAIGEDLLANIRRVSGRPCNTHLGQQSLARLQTRLFGPGSGRIVVLAGGVKNTEHLPGQIILINRSLVEDHEEVDVAAGYAVVEYLRARRHDPLVRLLNAVGLRASFRLLTTGDIAAPELASYAESLLTTEPATIAQSAILAQFATIGMRSSPYGFAVDISGETTLALIEADRTSERAANPLLDDGDWVSLQGICGE